MYFPTNRGTRQAFKSGLFPVQNEKPGISVNELSAMEKKRKRKSKKKRCNQTA
jgi:hypothetical protein